MATTSSTSSSASSSTASAVTTSSIDVASIVAQLMTVENQPMDTLKAKITGVQTKISDLGVMKSKVATLQSALTTFEDPSTYNNPSANSSDSSVVTATASSNAAIGSVSVSVSKLAAASKLVLTAGTDVHTADANGNANGNYTSVTALAGIDSTNGFSITVGGKTYNTKDSANPLVSNNVGGPTLTDLQNWINGLGANVQANITQTVSANDYVLQISGTQTGAANAVSVNVGANSHSLASSVSTAQDAVATIGGVTVNRSSNKISDVVNGITFNLVGQSTGSSAATVTVQQGADNSSAMINTLIKAYNDVVTQYNTYTANANSGLSTATTNGDFATDPTMLSFVNNIKSMFAYGATDTTNATIAGYGSASSAANIDTTSGYLKINGTKYNFSSIGQPNPTVSQFVSWVNGLGAGVTASFDGANIQINNSQTGGSNSIDLSGISNSVKRTTISLASMGMDIQLDGTIQFNTATYQQAATNGLASKLAKGLKMGFSGGGSSLDAFLVSEIDPAKGALVTQISNQQSSVTDLQKRQAELQDHLNQIQNNYITQYSALNALLFQLNSTSTSLTSALTAITNINAGK